ncbi:transcriptional regulator [Streptomonospora alba]|uniref:Transcriptional regulator n=1 Tax=Streptomonospora alba TaxID=183763 RepID=A0A0C2JL75_9ACTN|nr:TetR/AcrR family transcriptional regulator [Streptomonospora alba]KIH99675.1 transcriptional regulator [Streptomonospora alba]
MAQRAPEEQDKTSGRPRDRSIGEAAISATLEILETDGYFAVSVEAVARRAGTSRPAIYRRWSGRASLALAAVAARLDVPDSPDTGCTLCDLGDSFALFLAAYRTIRPDALSALYAECASDPDLRERYLDTVVAPVRCAVAQTLDRAVARGDLRPETDRGLLLDMVGSLVYYRAMLGQEHLSNDEAVHAIRILLQGAARDYGALLAHSEAMEHAHLHASTESG